jgi:Ubiquitin-activating enzyme E1 FCCH domain
MSLLSQRNLAGGELAPALYSRVDTVKYQTGVRQARNYTIIRSGGMQNRPGSSFCGETKIRDGVSKVRLIPFVFNNDQTYMLEFGEVYMRVIKDGAYVLNTTVRAITAITQASEAVVTSNAHGYANGDEIYIYGVVGMTELNGQNFIVSDQTANTFKIKYLDGDYVDSTAFTAYSSAGSVQEIYEIATPYAYEDLADLQYSQSADVLKIAGGYDYDLQDVTRTGDAAWAIADSQLVSNSSPGAFPTTAPGAGTVYHEYLVSSIDANGQEGPPVAVNGGGANYLAATVAAPHNIDWTPVADPDAVSYRVYLSYNPGGSIATGGPYGLIGTTSGTSFRNTGFSPDYDQSWWYGDYVDYLKPTVVAHVQQRLALANNDRTFGGSPVGAGLQPEEILLSRVGSTTNFRRSVAASSSEDSTVRIRMAGRQINEIRHIVDLNKVVVFTAGGEYALEGGANGIVTPFDINLKQYSYNGASKRSPIVIDSNALYIQARGSIVRDFGFDYAVDGYRGNDLTTFASHLFDGYEILDWAYQKTPNSIVWAVRDDGKLLSLTYIREHQIWGWTTHDTDGLVENVACIPEGNEDALYIVVKRTIDGRTARYVERLNTRFIDDPDDMIFMDSTLTYDGRNTDLSHTLEITSLSGWTHEDQQNIESSTAYFTAASVGEKFHIRDADGVLCIFTVESFFDTQNVVVRTDRDVPAAMRATPLTTWTRAVQTVKGLRHLEGKAVSILADSNVIASPNNPDVVTYTVTNGQVTLDDCYGVMHIGLPYISDIETLSIDNPGGESVIDKKMAINKVFVHVEKTRGLFAGTEAVADDADTAIDGLVEFKTRDLEEYDESIGLLTGFMDVVTEATYNNHGRVFLRQIDPLPATILAIHPAGEIPFK